MTATAPRQRLTSDAAIRAAGARRAAALPPMSQETAARLAHFVSAALEEVNSGAEDERVPAA